MEIEILRHSFDCSGDGTVAVIADDSHIFLLALGMKTLASSMFPLASRFNLSRHPMLLADARLC